MSPTLFLPATYVAARRYKNWRGVESANESALEGISNSIGQIEERYPASIPNLRATPQLFVTSDYSDPRRQGAKYEVFSFLIFSYPDATQWHSARLALRERCLEERSMSFKTLKDGVRWSALPDFLGAANTIPGILVTFAVSKTHRSLFHRGGRLDMKVDDLAAYRHWKPDAFEKLLRVVHFLSFLVAGLSTEGQTIMWYSDDDDIAPNTGPDDRTRTGELGSIWTNVIANYLPHSIPTVVIGTKKDDDPTKSLSDLIAIPDFACAAWCEFLARVTADNFINASPAIREALPHLSRRALHLLSWFVQSDQPLRRLLCVLDEPLPGNKVSYKCSVPPILEQFKREIDTYLAEGTAA